MEDSNPESVASPAGQSSGKSKLDTLSKEDLIKFAKKQMVSMQKMKSKCGDLEKEVEALKLRPVSEPVSDSSIIIQELTERMDAVLLERAESQQSLTLLRREHEELRRQAQDTTERLAALQEELDLKNKEHAEMQKHTAEITASLKTTCAEYESRISRTQEELEEAQLQWRSEVDALKDSQQMSLTEAQQEVENLQKEIQRMNAQYEEDLRFLEEQLELNNTDFERERERLLLLQDELSEQLALKEGFLQDVQEEEEDAARPVPAQETSELPAAEDSSDELRLTLEELQTHNMMLQEELVLLRNVKLELESDLKQLREEFTVEKEEMEFRINELQMNKDTGGEQCSVSEEEESQQADTGLSVERETQHVENLQDQHSPLDETPTVRSIIPDQDVELRGRAEHFIKQYKAMKEKTTASLLDLQERLKSVLQEPIDEGGQNVSYEELQHRNEEILVNLQHQEALVTQMLELIDVGPECELLSKQEDQLETKEKDECVKSLEEQLSALQAQQEVSGDTLRLLKSQIQSLSEERKDLQERLSAVQCHITEILQQSSGEAEADDASDISTLVDRLWSKCLEEKTLLSRRVEQLEVEMDGLRQTAEEHEVELQTRITELQREKDLQKTSLEDVLLDLEGLQKDLSQVQAMNEKLSTENHRLLAEVSDSKKNLEEEGREGSDERDDEADELQQALADKNTLISQLREEVGHLQMCKETPVSDESEKLKVLFEEIETLKKESKDKDERMNKIKAVAVKAKKELDGSKKEVLGLREEAEQLRAERDHLSRSVKDIIHGGEDYKNLMVDYDKQMELLDQERDKLEQAEKCSEDLTKRLQSALQQNELLSSEREDLTARVETLRSNVRLLETQALELQKQKSGLERDLEAERLVREQKTREHQCAVRELEELQAQLSRHTLQLQQTAQELEQLRKDAQQSSLLDMEMADYEKLVRELNQKLSERDRQLEEQDAHAQAQQEREQRLNQEIESLKLQLDQTEEKASKMKQLLVKTKKDLADAKQKEAAQMISQSTLRGELEAQQQQLDGYKIQVSELTAERHRLQEQLKLMSEQQHRSSSSYQLSVNTLQDQLSSAKADLGSTVSEFESYKVRVHNVLKQQKHKSSGQSDGDVFKQEREHMEDVLEQLRSRLQETQQSLLSSTSELQQLQTEHDTLLERHNRILQESVSKEAELRERLLSLQSENVSLKSEHGQCASQLSAQTEALRSSFREQTRHLQDEHCRTVETLQQQVGRLETQLFQLQKEPVSTGTGHQSRRSVLDRKSTDVSHVDLQSMAREECEGMETTETESLSSTGTPLPSLEQLLSTAELKHEPVVWQEEPSKEELTLKLSTAARSVEHLNSLLHETEATNAVLMEQITLLKSEVRRLERNHEREKSVANLEYLKNVLLQFIFLRSGSERQALLPVIHTMLQLSPDEKSKLAAIAQGEEESAVSRGSGWTSYLHSWSGIR